MAGYGRVFSAIWNDPAFTALEEGPQRLYLMLLSYPTRNAAGVLPLTLGRWTSQSCNTTKDSILSAIHTLGARRYVVADFQTEEALVRTYIKNDEVYRQPNVMRRALKDALAVASHGIRYTLSVELQRIIPLMPQTKDLTIIDETMATASALLNGISEGFIKGFAEGFPEGFAKGFAEPSGAGSYVSGVRNAPSPSPKPQAPVAEPFAGRPCAALAAEMVRELVPREHPKLIRDQLTQQAKMLLITDTDPELIRAGLQTWLTKNLPPSQLPCLVSDHIKRQQAPNANGEFLAPSTQRAFDQLDSIARKYTDRKEIS